MLEKTRLQFKPGLRIFRLFLVLLTLFLFVSNPARSEPIPTFQTIEELSSWVQAKLANLRNGDSPYKKFSLPFGLSLDAYVEESEKLRLALNDQYSKMLDSEDFSSTPRETLLTYLKIRRQIDEILEIQTTLLDGNSFVTEIGLQAEAFDNAKVFLKARLMELFVEDLDPTHYGNIQSVQDQPQALQNTKLRLSIEVGRYKNRPEDFSADLKGIPYEDFDALFENQYQEWLWDDIFRRFRATLVGVHNSKSLEDAQQAIKIDPNLHFLSRLVRLALEKTSFLEKVPGIQNPKVKQVFDRIYQSHLSSLIDETLLGLDPKALKKFRMAFELVLFQEEEPFDNIFCLKGCFFELRPYFAQRFLASKPAIHDIEKVAFGLIELLAQNKDPSIAKLSVYRELALSLIFTYAKKMNKGPDITLFHLLSGWVKRFEYKTSRQKESGNTSLIWIEIRKYFEDRLVPSKDFESETYHSNLHIFRLALLKRAVAEHNVDLQQQLNQEIENYNLRLNGPDAWLKSLPACRALLYRTFSRASAATDNIL